MKDYEHSYQKLGGWLLIIVIVTFIGAFATVLNLLSTKNGLPGLRNYEGGQFWLELLMQLCWAYAGALQVTYAVMIIRRGQRFARTWQLIYIGTFLRTLAQLVTHLIYGYPPSAFTASYPPEYAAAFGLTSDIVAFLPPAIGLLLLLLYLKKSVRVRTYMGSDNYLRLAFFTRKATGPVPMVPDAQAEQETA